MKAVLNVLVDYCFEDEKFKKSIEERSFLKELEPKKACYKCIVG